MKRLLPLLLFLMSSFSVLQAQSDIVITEIMYNNPGNDTLEFIELYNNTNATIDLTGYQFAAGVTFTFPNIDLAAGEYLLVATDSAAMRNAFGLTALEWAPATGVNNSGELVQLVDAMGDLVDEVEYSDSAPWPTAADGQGSSMVLCDFNTDNNIGSNWKAASTPTALMDVLANPGGASMCSSDPELRFIGGDISVREDEGTFMIGVEINGGNLNQTVVTLAVNTGNSTATEGLDFNISDMQITFQPQVNIDTQFIIIQIFDDMDQEAIENALLEITDATNNAQILPFSSSLNITILDDDTPLSNAMIISGVFDAHPDASGAKGIEFYVLEDIPDLSVYGYGSANNGLGSDGQEFTFPMVAASAGDCIYVTDNQMLFQAFFGFEADYASGASSINGDDAIELFENGEVIDVFGDINMDGSGLVWDYLDGWAYRKPGTGPDGVIFDEDNWTYSGVDALDGFATNNDASNPFPLCSYSPIAPTNIEAVNDFASTQINLGISIDVLQNDITPNGIDNILIIDDPDNGMASIDADNMVSYTPNTDYCGGDELLYRICDAFNCDTARVSITIACPPEFPFYDIGIIRNDSDNDTEVDSLGVSCELQGI
ncbi:MAG: lamin tail domain-containing protein, partial [Bacteroidota bacterium]